MSEWKVTCDTQANLFCLWVKIILYYCPSVLYRQKILGRILRPKRCMHATCTHPFFALSMVVSSNCYRFNAYCLKCLVCKVLVGMSIKFLCVFFLFLPSFFFFQILFFFFMVLLLSQFLV